VVAFAASELVMFAAGVLILPRAALSPALFADLGRAVVLAGGTLLVAVAVPRSAPVLAAAAAAVAFAALAVGLRLVSRSQLGFLAQMVRRRAAASRPQTEG
jgi:hypothetical protein